MTATTDGLFIVFEGGDGAGKSTQSARLAQYLTSQGYAVRTTFEPGDTSVGATVRQIVLHSDVPVSPRAETLLYAVDKAQHVEDVIKPALEAQMVVICDRYVDSTIAYQGAGRVLSIDQVSRIAWWAVADLVPDLTVLMDVSVEEGVGSKRGHDRIEASGADFHERVRGHLLALAAAAPDRYLVVNGRAPKDEVTRLICDRVDQILDSGAHQLSRHSR
ncbi:MAG: dTMP kinase [Propionibacteriaceae bacterium]|nr:dTMP kinase [Propionibacteriaceae bacterium]